MPRKTHQTSDRFNGGVEENDQLSYAYDVNFPNRLVNVTDASLSPIGFKDNLPAQQDDYAYDANGNMTRDLNKGITRIDYNHLNLPVKIVFGSEVNKIEYLYTASGKKLQKTYPYPSELAQSGYATNLIEYLDGFQYQNGSLKMFPTSEGYVTKTVSIYSYVYNHTDHLGNVRLSYALDASTGSTKILEENHYYPFGLKHANYNSDLLVANESQGKVSFKALAAPVSPVPPMLYNYKFNGMEYQDEMGLNLYDMPFRDYDPAIGRWTGMDPVIDYTASPYNGYDNNPVFWADPSGADVVITPGGVTFDGADAGAFFNAFLGAMDGNDTGFNIFGEIYDLSGMGSGGGFTDIIVGNGGIVYDRIGSGNTYRIFDKTGTQLFLNDYAMDSQWVSGFGVGDRLYNNIDESFFLSMIMKAGVSNPFLRGPGRTAVESYYSADFGTSQIAPKFGIPYEKTEYNDVFGGDGSFYRFGSQKSIYNLADAGNFMWGAWMRANIHSLELTTWAANKNSKWSGNGPDTLA